jgi:hypothetical protein
MTFACSSNDKKTGDNNQTTKSEEPGQIQETEGPAEEFTPVPALDYGGYKFRIFGFDGKGAMWQSMKISEIIAEEEIGEPIHDAIYKRNKIVEDLYNIKIDCVPVTYPNREDFARIATKAIMSGEDVFDAAFLVGMSVPAILGKKNMAHNLKTIPSIDLTASWWDQNSAKDLSIGNSLTMVIGDVNLYSSFAPVVIYGNKQLMKTYSINNLYQLVKEGKWTWDVLHDVAKQTSKDLDGNGRIDKKDPGGFSTEWGHMSVAIMCAGEKMTPKNNQDIPVLEPNKDRISALVEKILPVFTDSGTTIFGDDLTGYNNPYFEFLTPKFRDGEIMFLVQQLHVSFELRGMDADYAILPFPKLDENQKNYGSYITSAFATYTMIPITCEDTERTGNILQAMGYYSKQYVTPAFYDVTVTNKLVRDDESIDMLDIILQNRVFDLAILYEWGGVSGIFYNIAMKGMNNFSSQLEKLEPAINAAIENTLNELQVN